MLPNSPHFYELPPQPPEGIKIHLLLPSQSSPIELPQAFSGFNVRLIQMLSAQHGEFLTRSKKGKYETLVELGGHISQRYLIDRKELEKIQHLHRGIVQCWITQGGL